LNSVKFENLHFIFSILINADTDLSNDKELSEGGAEDEDEQDSEDGEDDPYAVAYRSR
jgi:hypothetical protein